MSKAQAKAKKKPIALTVAIAVVGVIFVALILAGRSPALSKKLGKGLSRRMIFVGGHISSLAPFSLYELTLYVLIITALVLLTKLIIRLIKARFLAALRSFLTMVLIALIVATTYFASVGFFYSLPVIDIPANSSGADAAVLSAAADYFFNDFNDLAESLPRDKKGNIKIPSDRRLAKEMQQEYKRLDGDYNPYTPVCKPIISSWVMSQMQVAGVFFAPFGEANFNRDMPPSSKPLVMLHELAHAKGVMQEDEADIMAAYMAFSSDIPYVRYSGYMRWYYQIIDLLNIAEGLTGDVIERAKLTNQKNGMLTGFNEKILAEWKIRDDFWSNYTLLEDATDVFYKAYLKVMGQKKSVKETIDQNGGDVPKINPDTGEQEINPDTGAPVFIFLRSPNLFQNVLLNLYGVKTAQ